jgi:hypothetical protein
MPKPSKTTNTLALLKAEQKAWRWLAEDTTTTVYYEGLCVELLQNTKCSITTAHQHIAAPLRQRMLRRLKRHITGRARPTLGPYLDSIEDYSLSLGVGASDYVEVPLARPLFCLFMVEEVREEIKEEIHRLAQQE